MLRTLGKTLTKFFSKGGRGQECNLKFSNEIPSLVIPHFEGRRKIKQMVCSKISTTTLSEKPSEVLQFYKM